MILMNNMVCVLWCEYVKTNWVAQKQDVDQLLIMLWLYASFDFSGQGFHTHKMICTCTSMGSNYTLHTALEKGNVELQGNNYLFLFTNCLMQLSS